MALNTQQHVVILVGGVGGAKLALGLQNIVAPDHLTIIVNTADDFWYYGLRVCPDIDTILYTLSRRVNQEMGWGVAHDTTTMLTTLGALGGETWFRLGDKDLATHLLRTQQLKQGQTLTQIVQSLARHMAIQPTVLPMTDAEVATIVTTIEYGQLAFQEYFVKHRWQPTVTALHYQGADDARMTDAVRQALQQADVILIGPSNPWLSIEPILTLPEMRATLKTSAAPVIAVTPIVEGKAIKGPTAKLMAELGYEVSVQAVADHYSPIIDGFIADYRDAIVKPNAKNWLNLDTIMTTETDKTCLAQQILQWINMMEVV